MSHKPTKSDLKAAQAKHLADLFGEEAPQAGEAQRAQDQQTARATKLSHAAAAKQRQLSDDEAAKLEELRRQAKKPTPAPSAEPAPTRPAPSDRSKTPEPTATAAETPAPPSGLHRLSDSNDLADAALRNMQAHVREQRQTPTDQADQPAPAPVEPAPPAPRPAAPSPSSPPISPQPTANDGQPPRQRPRRPAPSPEELDRLLKAMAARSRRSRGDAATQPAHPAPRPTTPEYGGAGEAAPDTAPQMEAPPDVPEEAPERNQEKQAEILKGLQDREATAQQQAPQIPQSDQPRAAVEPVEVKVPIVTDDNAVSAAPLHEALADLAEQMGAKNAPGQVEGANRVQRNMPGHPLYQPDQPGSDQSAPTGGQHG